MGVSLSPEQKSKWAHVASVATASAAIVAAVLSYLKDRPETKAKASYEVLAQKLDGIAAEQKKLHEDDVALRNYLDGYLRAMRDKTNDNTTSAVAAASASASPLRPLVRPPHVTRPTVKADTLYMPAPALPEPKAKPEQTAALPTFEQLPVK